MPAGSDRAAEPVLAQLFLGDGVEAGAAQRLHLFAELFRRHVQARERRARPAAGRSRGTSAPEPGAGVGRPSRASSRSAAVLRRRARSLGRPAGGGARPPAASAIAPRAAPARSRRGRIARAHPVAQDTAPGRARNDENQSCFLVASSACVIDARPDGHIPRWRALLAAAATLGLAGCDRSGSGPRCAPAGRRRRGLLGQHREAARGIRAPTCAAFIVEPRSRPAQLPAERRGRLRIIAQSDMAIVNGVGYDEWASQLLAASPLAVARGMTSTSARLLAPARRRQPAPLVLPGRRRSPSRDAITAALRARWTRTDAAYFRRPPEQLRSARAGRATTQLIAADPQPLPPAMPVGYSESIFAGARRTHSGFAR